MGRDPSSDAGSGTSAGRGGARCPLCQRPVLPIAKFCHECGYRLSSAGADMVERRRVSVLFADLEGFTQLAASRDPEEVRSILTEYFEACRRAVARNGGTIEKFIGDAVMAVWGAPVATENDTEMAVTTALELVHSVGSIGIGDGKLKLRAGITTGEAAVTLGSQHQAMVAGDVVNTASRIQSLAPAGAVYVDDATYEATMSTFTYVDAGSHVVKGKPDPIHLNQALNEAHEQQPVVPKFIGRNQEVAQLGEMFSRYMGDQSNTLICVSGSAKVGVSRLLQVFMEGLDPDNTGIAAGRVSILPGAPYAAVKEVIGRLIGLEEVTSVAELERAIGSIVSDEEGGYLGRALQQLFDPNPDSQWQQPELFAAWLRVIELAAGSRPLAIFIDEIRDGTSSVCDFLDFAVARSSAPLFIVAGVREEALEARAAWRAGGGVVAETLHISTLTDGNIEEILRQCTDGGDASTIKQIANLSKGAPGICMDTLKLLEIRGSLERSGARYLFRGAIGDISAPDSLRALADAQVDRLLPAEAAVLTTGAVLGETFASADVLQMSADAGAKTSAVLGQLVKKGLLTSVHGRGTVAEYSFAQPALRQALLARLTNRARAHLHLTAAKLSEEAGQASAAIAAYHFSEVLDIAPDISEAAEGFTRAAVAAGYFSMSAGAASDAIKYFEWALPRLSGEDKLAVLGQCGYICKLQGRLEEAIARFRDAISLANDMGIREAAAWNVAELGQSYAMCGDSRGAEALLREAYEKWPNDLLSPGQCLLARRYGEYLLDWGQVEDAAQVLDQAVEKAQWIRDPFSECNCLILRGMALYLRGRPLEALGIAEAANQIASETQDPRLIWFTSMLQTMVWHHQGEYALASATAEGGVEAASRLADVLRRAVSEGQMGWALYAQGHWDQALELFYGSKGTAAPGSQAEHPMLPAVRILGHRGRFAEAAKLIDQAELNAERGDRPASVASVPLALSSIALDEGDYDRAFEMAYNAFKMVQNTSSTLFVEDALGILVQSGREGGNWPGLNDVRAMASLEWPGRLTTKALAYIDILDAELTAHNGDTEAAANHFAKAVESLRSGRDPYALAVALSRQAVFLARNDEAGVNLLLQEARSAFQGLGAEASLRALSQVAA